MRAMIAGMWDTARVQGTVINSVMMASSTLITIFALPVVTITSRVANTLMIPAIMEIVPIKLTLIPMENVCLPQGQRKWCSQQFHSKVR